MANGPKRANWHPVDPVTAKLLTQGSSPPSVVYQVPSNVVPSQFHAIKGVTSK